MNFIAGGKSWPVTGQHVAGASVAAPRAIAHRGKMPVSIAKESATTSTPSTVKQ